MQELSRFLLTLWRGAVEKPSSEFKDWALSEVKALIPFSSCAWGMGRLINEQPVVDHVHLHNLPDDFIASWSAIQHEYTLTRDVAANNDHTFNINMARQYRNTETYNTYCKKYHIEHILGTGRMSTDSGLGSMMVFHRSDIGQPFSEEERALKELLFPHLVDAARANWLTSLPKMFSGHQGGIHALAVCESSGLLHAAMPSFVEILRKEWPDWKGPFVPADILGAAVGGSYVGEFIVIDISRNGELASLRARAKVRADALSARELEIARQISQGYDYKAIALKLDISPATVKTHTNRIYLKLGINDKAKLGAELGLLSA